MKKFNIILPVILFSNILISGQEITKDSNLDLKKSENLFNVFPSKSNVQFKKEIIKKDKEVGKAVTYTLIGGSVIVCGFVAYKVINYFYKKRKITKSRTLSNYELTKKLLKLETKFNDVNESKIFSKMWFKRTGEAVLTGVLTSGLTGAITPVFNDFYKKYNCLGSLNDFFISKAQSVAKFEEFLEDAKFFDTMRTSEDKGLYEQELKEIRFKLIAKIRNIVDELESVVAFMEQKIDSVDNVILTQEDVLIPSYLFDCLNEYCKNLQLLFDNNLEVGLHDLSAIFANDVVGIIDIFSGLETRISWLSRA